MRLWADVVLERYYCIQASLGPGMWETVRTGKDVYSWPKATCVRDLCSDILLYLLWPPTFRRGHWTYDWRSVVLQGAGREGCSMTLTILSCLWIPSPGLSSSTLTLQADEEDDWQNLEHGFTRMPLPNFTSHWQQPGSPSVPTALLSRGWPNITLHHSFLASCTRDKQVHMTCKGSTPERGQDDSPWLLWHLT